MKPIAVDQLTKAISGQFITAGNTRVCEGVNIDSRTTKAGQVFFAICGQRFDGHEYIDEVVEKGASCVVVSREVDLPQSLDTSIIRVNDTVKALGQLAAWYRRQLFAKVIGITGSVGKTTTRQILHQVLSRSYQCRQAEKSFNNHIGLPLTILSAEQEDDFLLLELGSNHPGEIESLAQIARPDMALVTLIGEAHLEGFGSVGNILQEKASIAKGLESSGLLYINGDQTELVDHVKEYYNVSYVTFGTNAGCDVQGKELDASGCTGSLVIEGHRILVPLAGRANLINTLAAWVLCRDLNISLSDFSSAVRTLKPIQMRMEVQHFGPVTVLNDCYNANPVSMKNALTSLNMMGTEMNKRKVFIAGSMAELGEQSGSLHFELGRQSISDGVDILLAVGQWAEKIIEGASENVAGLQVCQAFETTNQLCDNLNKWLEADDIVLVKGSRSANLEKVIERLRQLFSTSLKKSAEVTAD